MATPLSFMASAWAMVREAVEQVAVGAIRLARSLTRPMMMSSDTRPPVHDLFRGQTQFGASLMAARSISPVEICGMLYFSLMKLA
jgi:hypothetical protein